MPFGWDIGSGQIVDFNGKESNETDLIVYHKSLLPPIMFGDSLGIFPIESCRYVIEVKTTSNAEEIKTTIEKFRNLDKLDYLKAQDDTLYGLTTLYFAFNTDLTKETELERYKKYDKNWDTNPAIMVICVIGQGYWYFNSERDRNDKIVSSWIFLKSEQNNFEVAKLIGGMINSLNGNSIPPFGMYLME